MKPRILALAMLASIAVLASSAQGIYPSGRNIMERFIPPAGFARLYYPEGSFADYLRRLPLKSFDSPVLYYDGRVKAKSWHVSVFDMPLLKQDLIQCADAVIKIRAEYLYSQGRCNEICFTITNRAEIPFSKYTEGQRPFFSGNGIEWRPGYAGGMGQDVFSEYLVFLYTYAGTLSLSRELQPCLLASLKVGDVFINGGSPGHIVMVVDLAVNVETNEKVMLLAQSNMPSQDFHILKSFDTVSPWYRVRDAVLETPEWDFPRGSLKRFD